MMNIFSFYYIVSNFFDDIIFLLSINFPCDILIEIREPCKILKSYNDRKYVNAIV